MKEELKQPPMKPWQGILMVLGIVAAVFVASLLAQLSYYLTQTTYATYVLFLAVVAGVFYLFRTRISEYTYAVDDGKFGVLLVQGSRRKELLCVSLGDITGIFPYAELADHHPNVTVDKHTFLKKETTTAVVYRRDGKIRVSLVTVSDAFLDRLKQDKQAYDAQQRQEADATPAQSAPSQE
jgi:hypothetical protein